jgi:hypothetical protein
MHESKKAAILDDRREWLRIDDCLLLEYQVVGEMSCSIAGPADRAAEELITAFITKPTEDLLAGAHAREADSLLIPWLKKIDWVMETMLQRLVRISKEGIALPKLTEVNISGGGISFTASRKFAEGDLLDLRVILPPFTAIQTRVAITRVAETDGAHGKGPWCTGTRFLQISQDDHECLIRHILHVQAERLRARHLMHDTEV